MVEIQEIIIYLPIFFIKKSKNYKKNITSSKISILHLSKLVTLLARSKTLPGVETKICTVLYNLKISSLRLVPFIYF